MAISKPMLVLYWLKDGGTGQFPVPQLNTVLNYRPLANVVNLFAANLAIKNGQVTVDVPASIRSVLSGQANKLQMQGISVVLSIYNDPANKLGWSTLNSTQNLQLVSSIKSIITSTGLDGIDIDDEEVPGGDSGPQNFYNTVSAIRAALPDIIISNPVFKEQDFAKYRNHPDLITRMTYLATMDYGDSAESILGTVKLVHGIGVPMDKLCVGVQAGPARTRCDNKAFTSIETSKEVAAWARTNAFGVMLFSFSQDIGAFTGCPQHGRFPGTNDHAWQKAISSVLFD